MEDEGSFSDRFAAMNDQLKSSEALIRTLQNQLTTLSEQFDSLSQRVTRLEEKSVLPSNGGESNTMVELSSLSGRIRALEVEKSHRAMDAAGKRSFHGGNTPRGRNRSGGSSLYMAALMGGANHIAINGAPLPPTHPSSLPEKRVEDAPPDGPPPPGTAEMDEKKPTQRLSVVMGAARGRVEADAQPPDDSPTKNGSAPQPPRSPASSPRPHPIIPPISTGTASNGEDGDSSAPIKEYLKTCMERYDGVGDGDGDEYDAMLMNRRGHVLLEILVSEEKYVMRLQQVVDYYLIPLELPDGAQGVPVLSSDDLDAVFMNISDILELHVAFLHKLRERMGQWVSRGTGLVDAVVSDVFLEIVPFMRIYEYYCSTSFSEEIDRLCEQHGELNAFLDHRQALPAMDRLDLKSLLIMPVQRVPRYKLLLQELIRCTPGDAQDFHGLGGALSSILSMVQLINAREHDRQLEVIQAAFGDSIGGNSIVAPGRRWMLDGPLRSFDVLSKSESTPLSPGGDRQLHRKKLRRMQAEDIWLFLFNDLVVYGKNHSHYLGTLFLHKLWVKDLRDVSGLKEGKHMFLLWSAEQSFVLSCNSATEKQRWLAMTSKAIESFLSSHDEEKEVRRRLMLQMKCAALEVGAGDNQELIGELYKQLEQQASSWALGAYADFIVEEEELIYGIRRRSMKHSGAAVVSTPSQLRDYVATSQFRVTNAVPKDKVKGAGSKINKLWLKKSGGGAEKEKPATISLSGISRKIKKELKTNDKSESTIEITHHTGESAKQQALTSPRDASSPPVIHRKPSKITSPRSSSATPDDDASPSPHHTNGTAAPGEECKPSSSKVRRKAVRCTRCGEKFAKEDVDLGQGCPSCGYKGGAQEPASTKPIDVDDNAKEVPSAAPSPLPSLDVPKKPKRVVTIARATPRKKPPANTAAQGAATASSTSTPESKAASGRPTNTSSSSSTTTKTNPPNASPSPNQDASNNEDPKVPVPPPRTTEKKSAFARREAEQRRDSEFCKGLRTKEKDDDSKHTSTSAIQLRGPARSLPLHEASSTRRGASRTMRPRRGKPGAAGSMRRGGARGRGRGRGRGSMRRRGRGLRAARARGRGRGGGGEGGGGRGGGSPSSSISTLRRSHSVKCPSPSIAQRRRNRPPPRKPAELSKREPLPERPPTPSTSAATETHDTSDGGGEEGAGGGGGAWSNARPNREMEPRQKQRAKRLSTHITRTRALTQKQLPSEDRGRRCDGCHELLTLVDAMDAFCPYCGHRLLVDPPPLPKKGNTMTPPRRMTISSIRSTRPHASSPSSSAPSPSPSSDGDVASTPPKRKVSTLRSPKSPPPLPSTSGGTPQAHPHRDGRPPRPPRGHGGDGDGAGTKKKEKNAKSTPAAALSLRRPPTPISAMLSSTTTSSAPSSPSQSAVRSPPPPPHRPHA